MLSIQVTSKLSVLPDVLVTQQRIGFLEEFRWHVFTNSPFLDGIISQVRSAYVRLPRRVVLGPTEKSSNGSNQLLQHDLFRISWIQRHHDSVNLFYNICHPIDLAYAEPLLTRDFHSLLSNRFPFNL